MGVDGGRFTAEVEGDFVVFLIGMRFNKPWKVRKWWPVATAMPRMLRVIDEHPELGCLGYQQWIGRTTILVQYWRSFEDLDHFARDSDLPHLEPWRQFNKVVRDSGDVGIWHETFKVRAGSTKLCTATCLRSDSQLRPAMCRSGTSSTPRQPVSVRATQTSQSSIPTEQSGSGTAPASEVPTWDLERWLTRH